MKGGSSRSSHRPASVVVLAIAGLALGVAIASALTGQLTYQNCFADTNAAGCALPPNNALDGAAAVAVSPDGRSVYVASGGDDSISHFTRNASGGATNGNLTYQGCFADTNAAGCSVPANAALNGARGVAVSPDGKSVYVTSDTDDSISHFTRDTSGGATNGNLTYQGCVAETNAAGCSVPTNAALNGAVGVTVSSDNKSVYVTSTSDSSISHFTRDASGGGTNGNLTYQGCFADTNADGCQVPANAALATAFGVAVSPDGKSVYVTSFSDTSISHFTRDASGGGSNGNLTYQGCFADTNAAGCSVPSNAALSGAYTVAVSPDNRSVYVASTGIGSILQFTRDASGGGTNGNLTYQGCFADTNADDCQVPASAALGGARVVSVAPDGASVYVTADGDNSISHFTRDASGGATNGNLAFEGCFADTNGLGCAVPVNAALDDARGVAVAPDGKSVYVASVSDHSVSHFKREQTDTDPPQTRITKGANRSDTGRVKFRFKADELGSTFECKLKGKGLKQRFRQFRNCSSPRSYRNLDQGRYVFIVRATDAAGNVDPTPARDRFKVVG